MAMPREYARLTLLTGLLAFVSTARAEVAGVPETIRQAADTYITRAALEAPIRFLSSDLLEGRGPGTRGDEVARLYLQTQLESMGYQPAFPSGDWQQPFDLIHIKSAMPATWSFQATGARVDLKLRDDYSAASGVQADRVTVNDAELVFVGYGIQAPEYRWDDLKGANLTGKILVMMNNNPDWDPNLFAGKRRLYYGRWTYKYESAARQGAVGAIIIHTAASAGYPWQVVQDTSEIFELPAGNQSPLRLKAWMTEEAVRRVLTVGGYDLDKLVAAARSRDFKPVPLGIRTSIDFTNTQSTIKTANVGGILPGSDPRLTKQIVVLSAHHDHLGIGKPDANGDRIYHGAVDNALGCAQVVAAARAFSALPERTRRTLLVLFVAAEEQQYLGSKYYTEHPSVPVGRIAADVNLEGAFDRAIFGRTHDATLIGMNKSSLDAIAESVARSQGRTLGPDQFPDRGYFYRSDQFSFARIGVPALNFGEGTEVIGRPADWRRQQVEAWERQKYHQPGDKLDDSWNFEGVIEDAQLAMLSTWLIAQADAMPTWKAGDEFEAARKRALSEVAP
jgi:Zn-dependent M28 family amino/carboxypeptidase